MVHVSGTHFAKTLLFLCVLMVGLPAAGAPKCIGLKKAYLGKCYYPEEISKLKARSAARKAQVTVTSDAEGADVYLNGEKVGVTPWKSKLLKAGRYSIAVTKLNHRKVEQWVELKRGDRRTLQLNPVAQQGSLSLRAKGSDGRVINAEIRLGKERLGSTPLELKMDVGSYTLTLTDPAGRYEETNVELSVKDGQVISRDVVLQRPAPKRASVDPSKRPTLADASPAEATKSEDDKSLFGEKGRLFISANTGFGLFYNNETQGSAERISSSLALLADLRLGYSIRKNTALYLIASIAPTLTEPTISTSNTFDFPNLGSGYFPFFIGVGAGTISRNDMKVMLSGAIGVTSLSFNDVITPDAACGDNAADADSIAPEATFQNTSTTQGFCSTKTGSFTKYGLGVMGDLTYPIAQVGDMLISLGAQLSFAVVSTTAANSTSSFDITHLVGTAGGTLSVTYF